MSNTILFKNATILAHDDTDKHVKVLRNTDLLVENDRITQITTNISPPKHASNVQEINCTDKILSPGFINTHSHLWQTQLKGRHADKTLLDYFPSGNMQSNNYSAEDMFWGQLAGAMESLDAGTTCGLDHAHGCVSEEMANQALSATVTSGIRAVFAYAKPPLRVSKWTQNEIVPADDGPGGLDLALGHIERLAKGQPYGDGRVTIGMAFDAYFLPEARVKEAFERAIAAGVKVVTSHIVNATFSTCASSSKPDASIQALKKYNLLTTTPNLVLSHCTNLAKSDYELLSTTQTAISRTPETEAQMAHGAPAFLTHPSLNLNVSLGVDCHTNNSSFMPQIGRAGLFCARLASNEVVLAKDKFPRKPRGDTEAVFNAYTILGAKAIGMEKDIGSLRVGKKADIVVVDGKGTGVSCVAVRDPLVAVVRHCCVRDVQGVVVDGVVRKWCGVLCPVRRKGVDGLDQGGEEGEMGWDRVRERLLESMRGIWERDAKCSRKIARDYTLKVFGGDEGNLVDADVEVD